MTLKRATTIGCLLLVGVVLAVIGYCVAAGLHLLCCYWVGTIHPAMWRLHGYPLAFWVANLAAIVLVLLYGYFLLLLVRCIRRALRSEKAFP